MVKTAGPVTLLLLAACSDLPASQSPEDEANLKAYSTSYVASCVSVAVVSGSPPDFADKMCKCGMGLLAERNSMAELRMLPLSEQQFVMDQCRTQIGTDNG
jgi:hypothetical protein